MDGWGMVDCASGGWIAANIDTDTDTCYLSNQPKPTQPTHLTFGTSYQSIPSIPSQYVLTWIA